MVYVIGQKFQLVVFAAPKLQNRHFNIKSELGNQLFFKPAGNTFGKNLTDRIQIERDRHFLAVDHPFNFVHIRVPSRKTA